MKTSNKKLIAAIILMVVGIIFRLLQIAPNFTPMTAIALFGGAYLLDKRLSVIVTIASLFISDVLLAKMNHYPVLHDTIFFVYGAYLLIVFLGWKLQNGKFSFLTAGGFAVLSSVLFFVVSNIGVWLVGVLYPVTLDGLFSCFTNAIPFYKYTFIGDVVYTLLFFGIYNLIFNSEKPLRPETSKV